MGEEASFFESHGHRLFSVLHRPDDVQEIRADTGVIICDAFGEEKLWSHRVLVNFARFLAQRSFHILRFDCMGHGDSEGNYEQVTIETQVNDVLRAMEVLRVRTGVRRIVLHGVRFGATLAAIVAARSGCIDAVTLWNPIIDGEKYFQECLRSAVTTQMTTYGKVRYTRAEMVNDLRAGKAVNSDGYLISPELYKGMVQIRLADVLKDYQRPFAVIQVKKDEAAPIDKDAQQFCSVMEQARKPLRVAAVTGNWFWKELNIYPQHEQLLYEVTWKTLLEPNDQEQEQPGAVAHH